MVFNDDGGDVVEDEFHQVREEAKTGFSQLSLSQVFFLSLSPPPHQSHQSHHPHQHSHHVFHHSTSGSVEFLISRSHRPCSILLAPFPAAFRRWALSHYMSLSLSLSLPLSLSLSSPISLSLPLTNCINPFGARSVFRIIQHNHH